MPDQCLEEQPFGWCEMHLTRVGRKVLGHFTWRIVPAHVTFEGLVDRVVAEIRRPSADLHGLSRLGLGGASGHGSNSR
jgi:hypothetical protein